jgi:outer membrane murein-binding lipoprotein Lpp
MSVSDDSPNDKEPVVGFFAKNGQHLKMDIAVMGVCLLSVGALYAKVDQLQVDVRDLKSISASSEIGILKVRMQATEDARIELKNDLNGRLDRLEKQNEEIIRILGVRK